MRRNIQRAEAGSTRTHKEDTEAEKKRKKLRREQGDRGKSHGRKPKVYYCVAPAVAKRLGEKKEEW